MPKTPWRTATQIIRKMVEHQLLVTTPDPEDGRCIFVGVSPCAVRLLYRYFDNILDMFESMDTTSQPNGTTLQIARKQESSSNNYTYSNPAEAVR